MPASRSSVHRMLAVVAQPRRPTSNHCSRVQCAAALMALYNSIYYIGLLGCCDRLNHAVVSVTAMHMLLCRNCVNTWTAIVAEWTVKAWIGVVDVIVTVTLRCHVLSSPHGRPRLSRSQSSFSSTHTHTHTHTHTTDQLLYTATNVVGNQSNFWCVAA